MRGDVAFRESSKSYIQFANEIYIYSTVLPYYDKFLKEMNLKEIKILDLVPPVFKAQFGYIEGIVGQYVLLLLLSVLMFHSLFIFKRLKLFAYGKRSRFGYGELKTFRLSIRSQADTQ